MLFRRFAGPTVRAASGLGRAGGDADDAPRSFAPLVALARTFAGVQVMIAALPCAATAGIPRVAVDQLPAQFDELLRLLCDRHLAAWRADDGAILREMGLPGDPLAQLTHWRAAVAGWAAELAAGAWPATIDHVDLHAYNAILQSDGTPLIYDWEEATIGCPFFSLDRLLAEARWFDRGGDPAIQAADGAGGGPAERAVRAAYLAALPWGDRAARARPRSRPGARPDQASPRRRSLRRRAGSSQGPPRYTAWLLARALWRWPVLGG